MQDYANKAFDDIRGAIHGWRIWLMLGVNDIGRRYRRSRIGQFWITASTAVMVGSLGFIYSSIFGLKINEYLPHVAISLVLWNLLASLVNDGCMAFVDAEAYIKQLPLAKSIYVLRVVCRSLIVAAHNFIIVVAVMVIFAIPLRPVSLILIPALALIVLNGTWIGLLLGTLSARFRDIPQTVQSIMQVVFFITPVMFIPKQIPSNVQTFLDFNPFAAFLALARDPLLGQMPRLQDFVIVLITVSVGWLFVIPFFGKFRDRIVYWL